MWRSYMAPVAFLAMLACVPVLDTLVAAHYVAGRLSTRLDRVVDVDNYMLMRDVVRAAAGSLPSSILQSVRRILLAVADNK